MWKNVFLILEALRVPPAFTGSTEKRSTAEQKHPREDIPGYFHNMKKGQGHEIELEDIPESSKGVKFEPLNHQKQTQGLKFDTLGGSRY